MPTNKNKEQVEKWFKTLRDQICKSFEEIEDKFQHKLVKEKPGRFIRKVTEEEVKAIKENAIRYQENWKKYSKSIF